MSKGASAIRFAFFGTGSIGRYVCEELEHAGFLPALVVTTEDKAVGRGLSLEASTVAEWAHSKGVRTFKTAHAEHAMPELAGTDWDAFVVADYGYFIPKELLTMPTHGCLNVHPSLLPRLRGPSPIRSAILNDERETGISIILLDEELDHGPLVAQKRVPINPWPPRGKELDELLGREGGRLLAQIFPEWIAGKIESHPQNHDLATYCEKFGKEDGLLNLSDDAYKNLLKIRAFEEWPGTYTFFERPSTRSGQAGKRIRVGILDAHIDPPAGGGKLILDRVKPEGKREMGYEEFLRSGASPAQIA